jgi:hypothetical protein
VSERGIATLRYFAVLSVQTSTMTTPISPPDQRAPQPPLQTLSDSLRGDLHFPGDQTCADSREVLFRRDRRLKPILRV